MFSGIGNGALSLINPALNVALNVGPFCGFIIGFALMRWYALSRGAREGEKASGAVILWQSIAAIGLAVGPGLFWLLRELGFVGMPDWHLLAYVVGGVLGLVTPLVWARFVTPRVSRVLHRVTRRSDLERNRKTDVREISGHLPDTAKPFDPAKYMRADKGVFLGLDEARKPQYISTDLWRRSHVQLIGTSGAGKGVASAVLLSQALRDGEAVVVLDPKNDEWAPHVLRAEAERQGVPFYLVDLRGASPQLSLFDGASAEEVEELLVAGFSLSEKGEAADFYRIADRQAARLAGSVSQLLGRGVTPRLLAEQPDMRKQKAVAPGFMGRLDELARVPALDAPNGRYLSEVVARGGCVYVIGSMRNERIKAAQRMVLVRLLQIVEQRDRISSQPRPVCVFLDELKYHLSRPALEGLGAARDKGMHLILAHQSLADLRDCPADLDGEAVVGAVVENCALRVAYRVRDPETAEWLARMSGTILVDDETRRVERNVALAEVMDADRTVRQSERYLMDPNMLLNLPDRAAVFYGGRLPVFAHIRPIAAEKRALELVNPEPMNEPEAEPAAPAPAKKLTNPTQLEALPDVDF